jgi:hypothetical protein
LGITTTPIKTACQKMRGGFRLRGCGGRVSWRFLIVAAAHEPSITCHPGSTAQRKLKRLERLDSEQRSSASVVAQLSPSAEPWAPPSSSLPASSAQRISPLGPRGADSPTPFYGRHRSSIADEGVFFVAVQSKARKGDFVVHGHRFARGLKGGPRILLGR